MTPTPWSVTATLDLGHAHLDDLEQSVELILSDYPDAIPTPLLPTERPTAPCAACVSTLPCGEVRDTVPCPPWFRVEGVVLNGMAP